MEKFAKTEIMENTFNTNFNDELKECCGEIYLTQNKVLVLNCCACQEKFGTFRSFIEHLSLYHYNDWCFIEAENYETYKSNTFDILECTYEAEPPLKETSEGNVTIKSQDDSTHENSNKVDCNETNSIGNFEEICNINEVEAESDYLEHEKESIPKKRKRTRTKTRNNQERIHKCNFCDAAFTDKSNMLSHQKRHSGEKEHQCEFCPKRFYTRSELKTHMCFHTRERPFICSTCGKGFLTSGAMTGHMRRHTNERPYKCDHCDRRFYNGTHLKDHMVTHTKERKHVCEVCSSAFMGRKTLKQHMKIHANKREYVCFVCKAAYNQGPALFLHMKKHGERLHKNAIE